MTKSKLQAARDQIAKDLKDMISGTRAKDLSDEHIDALDDDTMTQLARMFPLTLKGAKRRKYKNLFKEEAYKRIDSEV